VFNDVFGFLLNFVNRDRYFGFTLAGFSRGHRFLDWRGTGRVR
jgi:hypothetical protein